MAKSAFCLARHAQTFEIAMDEQGRTHAFYIQDDGPTAGVIMQNSQISPDDPVQWTDSTQLGAASWPSGARAARVGAADNQGRMSVVAFVPNDEYGTYYICFPNSDTPTWIEIKQE